MLALFTLTVLVSATLLFLVQPLFARLVLPMLGGSPAVWNTALVFYQLTLLAGYAYAHFVSARLSLRRQALLHGVVVLAAFVSLPIAIPRGWTPPTESSPVLWMLGLLAVGIGIPFFVVSTTGPLVQRWFAHTTHRSARDPYFLYAASNLGSMVGLLSYPALLEPRLRLAEQSGLWTGGYVLLVVLIVGCALAAVRSGRAVTAVDAEAEAAGAAGVAASPADGPGSDVPLTPLRRARWVLLAFVPASLMMGSTTHITTDIAAIPLLWVLPLAVYLLSFILVFARRPLIPHAFMCRALPLVILPLIMVMAARALEPLKLIVGLHLLALFVVAMVCHGELAKDRPSAAHLTEFYLWLAVGGALGGVFNALLAPVAFHSVVEYPIAIVLACLVMPPKRALDPGTRARVMDFVLPILMGGFVVGLVHVLVATHNPIGGGAIVLLYAVLAFPLLAFSQRPLRFGLALAALLHVDPAGFAARERLLHQERSFFGVHRVLVSEARTHHKLIHGTTLHGLQRWKPKACDTPLGYYHRQGPAGDVFGMLPDSGGRRIAIAGLGAGSLAAYAKPGEQWTLYEIDPAVERIASDTSWFCYLSACRAPYHVVLGDARRSIAATSERYDVMVFDAYTSDAIPVHLITREAVRLYAERLTPHGVMAFHLSNRYFDLVPVVARLAEDARLVCRVRVFAPPKPSAGTNEDDVPAGSAYAVLARTESDLGALAADPAWKPARTRAGLRVWTDDYSSLLSVLR